MTRNLICEGPTLLIENRQLFNCTSSLPSFPPRCPLFVPSLELVTRPNSGAWPMEKIHAMAAVTSPIAWYAIRPVAHLGGAAFKQGVLLKAKLDVLPV